MFSPFPPWTHLYPTIIFLPPLLPWFLQLLWIVCTLLSKDLELRIAEEREPGLHHSIWWLLIPYIYLQISWFNYSLQINGVYMPHFYLLVEGQLGCFDFLAIVNRECKEFGWAKYLLSPLGICWGVLGHVVLGHVVDLFLTFFFFWGFLHIHFQSGWNSLQSYWQWMWAPFSIHAHALQHLILLLLVVVDLCFSDCDKMKFQSCFDFFNW